jgi:hypothetical protein
VRAGKKSFDRMNRMNRMKRGIVFSESMLKRREKSFDRVKAGRWTADFRISRIKTGSDNAMSGTRLSIDSIEELRRLS